MRLGKQNQREELRVMKTLGHGRGREGLKKKKQLENAAEKIRVFLVIWHHGNESESLSFRSIQM